METTLSVYHDIKGVVQRFVTHLRFSTFLKTTGRKLALSLTEIIALALFKQAETIGTKKSLYEICRPNCSYKTMVVNLNRWFFLAAIIIALIMKMNRGNQHPIKHIDSTDIPVCLFKNANGHQTMRAFAAFGRSSKGIFFGLKLHIITDLQRKLLKIRFTAGDVGDREVVIPMTDEIGGILVADAGYISQKLARAFYQEGQRMFFAKPRSNMRKLMTKFQEWLYGTRMLIEINFRNLKMFYGLITSLPRSVAGYFANYIYSLLAYLLA